VQTTIHHVKSCKRSFRQRDVRTLIMGGLKAHSQQDIHYKIRKQKNLFLSRHHVGGLLQTIQITY